MNWITHTFEPWMPIGATKAKDDIASIAIKEGFKELKIIRANKSFPDLNNITAGDLIVHQYPTYLGDSLELDFINSIHELHAKIVILIHDFEPYRINNYTNSKYAFNIIQSSDALIVHTDKMKKKFKQTGFQKDIFVLEAFDYLADIYKLNAIDKIVYAGTLAKANWIFDYKETFNIHLYGKLPKQFPDKLNPNLKLHQPVEPLKLASEISRYQWGLVWDSDFSNKTNYQKYQQINAPHKLSLYIASGIPVIVPSNSAMEDFVLKNNIGISVNSLSEIPSKIKNSNPNVLELSGKMRDGFFTKKILSNLIIGKN
ncbi:MAG: beta-1,6-galactofuranosyltransferase [Lactobacillaceae bacterium]|jgi:hypothetical protein|nr:beta-1,6-galactofuranosyltransferase [Lactobacillaceae bacterium]